MTNTNYVPTYKSVTPPIKGLDVDRKYYTVNTETENVLTAESGTKIFIPKDAFADAKGNPVKGAVTVSYREFRDPIDFLVSGIPMKYDTAGETTILKSAGEFEITASVDNQPVQLAADKIINMNFVSTTTDSSYNFYQFNDSTGNWEYLNKLQTVSNSTKTETQLSQAYKVYRGYVSYERKLKDETPLNERFENLKYVYTEKKDTARKQRNLFYYFFKKRERVRSMDNLVRINQVRKTKDGKVFCKISYVDKAHPELRAFRNYYFAVNDNRTAVDFKKEFIRKELFNDVRIYPNGNDFEIKLKGQSGFKTIDASLANIDRYGKITKIKNTKSIAKQYSKSLRNREKSFVKAIKKQRSNMYLSPIPRTSGFDQKAYSACKPLLTRQERRLSHDEWQKYCNEQEEIQKAETAVTVADLDKRAATTKNLVNSLSIGGMGIYNCDQINRVKSPVEIYARYTNDKSEKMQEKTAYIIDKNVNSLLRYDGYGYSAHKIVFSNSDDAQNVLLAIGADGNMAIYKPEEFKRNIFTDESHFNFVVTPINSNISSVGDLKKLIGL